MGKKQIFLASSSELKEDRSAFEIFINRKNKEWYDKGVFLELIVWEDFMDAVAQTRLQDEYNQAIRESDIFVMLFFTKVGKFTQEEFETAFGQFKINNKPFIFTYFKDAAINTGSASRDDLQSLWAFQDKIKELGHFVTVYKNIEELQLKFTQQLDKLVANGSITFNKLHPDDKNYFSDSHSSNEQRFTKELSNRIPRTDPRDIVGRTEDLQHLHELLTKDNRVVVVNGLGGIGKTTLAQAYVSKYYSDYQHILWITQSAENITNDFVNADGLVQNLGIQGAGLLPEQVFEQIIRKLKAIPENPNLLVIDNAERSLSNYTDVLPTQPMWNFLITSREDIDGFYPKQLDFLTEQQAIQLFQSHYSRKSLTVSEIKEIVEAVDYHTLTIEILAKTAQVQRSDVSTLKEAIRNDLKANVKINRRKQNIEKIGSYLTTVFNISSLNDVEVWLMQQLACLPSEYQAYDLLKQLIIHEQSPHKEMFSETLDTITKKGWLLYNEDTDSYKMHRIIAAVVKREHPITANAVDSLITNLIEKLGIDFNTDDPVERLIWIPYCKSVLGNITDTSLKIAQLENNLGNILLHLGQFAEARLFYEKSVVIYEEIYGVESGEALTISNNLARAMINLQDYEEGRKRLERNIQLAEKMFGSDHPDAITGYEVMGLLLRAEGRLKEAKLIREKVTASTEKFYGVDHPSTAISYLNHANILIELGEYKEAETLVKKGIKICEKSLGETHINTGFMYHNMAISLYYLGDENKALLFMKKTLQIFDKSLPKDHPRVATANKWYQLIAGTQTTTEQ